MKTRISQTGRNGSFLLIAALLALVLTSLVASFISLSTTAVKTTEANYTHHATLLPSEEGLDRGFATLSKYAEVLRGGSLQFNFANQPDADKIWTKAGWTGSPSSNNLAIELNSNSAIALGNGRTATVKVKVFNVPTATSGTPLSEPYMVAQMTYAPTVAFGGSTYTRQIYAKAGWSPLFPFAMLARNLIDLNGHNVSVDSFNGALPTGAAGDVASGSRDLATVVSLSTNLGVNGGNAIIFGFVATGGDAKTDVDFGPNAHVWGTISDPNSTGTPFELKGVHPARVSGGFSINPDLLLPIPYVTGTDAPGTWSGIPDADGVLTIDGGAGTYFKLPATGLIVGSGAVKKVVVKGNVKLLLGSTNQEGQTTLAKASTLPEFTIAGTGSLSLEPNATLAIYSPGNIKISGGGVVNNTAPGVYGQATNFTIFGLNLNTDKIKGQTIDFTGNAANIGLVHAPNASITMAGGGSSGIMIGALIAYNITANGDIQFHYDEKLLLQQFPSPQLIRWVELKGDKKITF